MFHLCKSRVLSPLRSLRTCVRNEVELVPLACEDGGFTALIDFSLTVKAATLIFISERGSAISSAKEGKSGFIFNLVKS